MNLKKKKGIKGREGFCDTHRNGEDASTKGQTARAASEEERMAEGFQDKGSVIGDNSTGRGQFSRLAS